jgi:hypothetical protein
VKPTDMIGFMYNSLRKDLVEMMDKPMEIRQFQGLLVGNTPTQAMLEESRLVFHAFAAGNNMLREVMDLKVALLTKAEAEFAYCQGKRTTGEHQDCPQGNCEGSR